MSKKPTAGAPVAGNQNSLRIAITLSAAALLASVIVSEEMSDLALHKFNRNTLSKLPVMNNSMTVLEKFDEQSSATNTTFPVIV
jgi:hypothetical protein